MAKSEYLQIRCNEEMKEKLKAISERKSLSISSLCLNYISNGIDNDEKTSKIFSPEGFKEIMSALPDDVVRSMLESFKK